MIHRSTAVKALIGVAALLVVAACGSSGSSSSSSSSSGGSSGAPVKGGNLTFAAVQDAQSMNATTVFDNNSIWIFEQIYQTLYTVTNNGKGVKPLLATSYTMSSDKKTYTFQLRKGVKFSNGKTMTSADVKFSIDQNRKAAQGWAYLDSAIKSVDAPSPDTVVIHLKFPWAPLLADLSIFANGIVPNNYGGETENEFYQHPVGTGPFKWDYWHKGSALKLVRNPLYWEKGKPYLDSVTWTDVPETTTPGSCSSRAARPRSPDPPLVHGGQPEVHAERQHVPVPVDADQLHVLQRERASRSRTCTCAGRSRWPSTGRPWSRPCCSATGSRRTRCSRRRCPTTRRAPLACSSTWRRPSRRWPSPVCRTGSPRPLLIASGNSDYLTISTIVQSELKPLGIKVKIQQLDPNTENTDTQSLKYDMNLTLWTMDIPDPDELATFAVDPTSGAKSFFTDYNNPAVIKATHQAEVTTNAAQRQAFYNTVQTGAAERRVHGVPVLLAVPVRDHEQRARLLRDAARQHAHGGCLAQQVVTNCITSTPMRGGDGPWAG